MIKYSNGIKVEPYWNVNSFKIVLDMLIPSIKVEPYWNVNLPGTAFPKCFALY